MLLCDVLTSYDPPIGDDFASSLCDRRASEPDRCAQP
jgi:hypothetical protein